MDLVTFVSQHIERGKCKCGKCYDAGVKPDPTEHTADVIFFVASIKDSPSAKEFERLSRKHRGCFNSVDVFDGNEHGFMELGGWLGDQEIALCYMALGKLLGKFDLLTPRSMLGDLVDADTQMMMAQSGMITVKSCCPSSPHSPS